jgi:predicted nucleic acid-binding protein
VIVVDSNIVCYFAIPGSRTATVSRLREIDPEWCVPLLWRSEFRNVLVGQVRRGAIDFQGAQDLVQWTEAMVRGLEFEVDSGAVLARAMESGCTAYDCEYVALADALGLKLVTSDKQVLAAFPTRAVALEDYLELAS